MSEVNERTQRTSLLRGPVEDIPGLTVYLATNFLPLAGGTISGELFIASGGGLYLYDASAAADVQISVDDGHLLVGGVILLDNNSTLDASKLGVGTVPDARLSSNVARRDQANTFVGTVTVGGTTAVNLDLKNSSGSTYAFFNGTARSFFAGGDAFAVLIDGTARLYNNGVLAWNNAIQASSGTIDASIRRNATGPTLETRAAGGLKVCNADGSAVTRVECNDLMVGGSNLVLGNESSYLALYTSAAKSAYNVLLCNFVQTASAGTVMRRSSGFVMRNNADGKLLYTNWGATGGAVLDFNTANTLTIRNQADSAGGGISLANLTASGSVQGGTIVSLGNVIAVGYSDAKHRPYTFAGLPLASAARDKTFVCTDSTLAMNGTNYGTTPAGGGANRVKVFSNGTVWMVG